LTLLLAADLVAAGTLALAGVTFLLVVVAVMQAALTRRTLAVTQQSVDVANKGLAARLRPVLVDVPLGTPGRYEVGSAFDLPGLIAVSADPQTRKQRISVPIRNVGPGLAVLATPHPTIFEREGVHYQGKASRTVIPPAETAHLSFELDGKRGAFYVQVAYTDVAGEQMTRTQLFIRTHTQDEPTRVVGLALFVGPDSPGEKPLVFYGEGFV
jgi:hypothetical protein